MAYPAYIREKAIQLRVERDLTIDEIAERLALPRTTIFYWVKDIPLKRERQPSLKLAQIRAGEASRARHQKLRDDAYARGIEEWEELALQPTFREFVALYIAEGYKRNRNVVSIANSDDRIVALAVSWFRRLGRGKLDFSIQYHADQDLGELREFWGRALGIDGAVIRMQRKSNSNQLAGRTWRSAHGVMTVAAYETLLRSRLQAWIDLIRQEWTLDSAESRGV
jgi:transposase-like protein